MKNSELKRRRRTVRMVMTGLDLKLAEQRDKNLREIGEKVALTANTVSANT